MFCRPSAGARDISNPVKGMPHATDVPSDIMHQYLDDLFSSVDVNRNGVLQSEEFAQALARSGFRFSKAHVQQMLATKRRRVLQKEEFVSFMTKRLTTRPPVGDSMWEGTETPFVMRDLEDYSDPSDKEGMFEFLSWCSRCRKPVPVTGDWWHESFNLRIQRSSATFFGSTFYYPEEFEVTEATVGMKSVKIIVKYPSLDHSRALWNLKLTPDQTQLVGKVYKTGFQNGTEVVLRRMNRSPFQPTGLLVHIPPPGVSQLDRMMMADMKSNNGTSAIPASR